jgi:hypothetical protein
LRRVRHARGVVGAEWRGEWWSTEIDVSVVCGVVDHDGVDIDARAAAGTPGTMRAMTHRHEPPLWP